MMHVACLTSTEVLQYEGRISHDDTTEFMNSDRYEAIRFFNVNSETEVTSVPSNLYPMNDYFEEFFNYDGFEL